MIARAVVFALVVAMGVGWTGSTPAPVASTVTQNDIDTACDYYRVRAGPGPHSAPLNFSEFLSGTCDAAKLSLETGGETQKAAAQALLEKIAKLYLTVADMNADRDKAVAGLTGVTRMLRLTRVTPTGEYLIAHQMGLLKDFHAWIDTGADFSLAWYR